MDPHDRHQRYFSPPDIKKPNQNRNYLKIKSDSESEHIKPVIKYNRREFETISKKEQIVYYRSKTKNVKPAIKANISD